MSKVDFNTKKLANKVNKKLALFTRKIALDGLRQLIRQSPVDTGRFKANWSTSVGSVGSFSTEIASSAPKGVLTGTISSQSKDIAGYKVNQTAFLYNNLQYAIPLEYGHSKQAPLGWVRNTSIMMQKKLNEVKDLL